MRIDGVVSMWIGSARSRDALDRALHASFSEDGDFLGSPFSRGFDLGYYDDAMREAEFLSVAPRRVADLFVGSSYSEITVPRFQRLGTTLAPGDNCVVLLFDYRYRGVATSWSGSGVLLRFVGAVSYR